MTPAALLQHARRKEGPVLQVEAFSGPLDLLLQLVESQRIDLRDIPIAQITDQYLNYLRAMEELDMDLAADFLVMAAMLIQIKSRMLLPKVKDIVDEDEDPRRDLVLRLLEYRRCRLLAERLREAAGTTVGERLRLPEPAAKLGIVLHDPEADAKSLRPPRFQLAARRLAERNTLRFRSMEERFQAILDRERVSLPDTMKHIWDRLRLNKRISFRELFPPERSRTERVTAFLALLELLRGRWLDVEQDGNFAELELRWRSPKPSETGGTSGDRFSDWLSRQNFELEGDGTEGKRSQAGEEAEDGDA